MLIILVGWALTDLVIEPRLKGTAVDGDPKDMPVMEALAPNEIRGLVAGFVAAVLAIAVMAAIGAALLYADKAPTPPSMAEEPDPGPAHAAYAAQWRAAVG